MEHMTVLVAGMVCVILSGLMLYKLPPREGQAPSAWTRTEGRATASAMLTLILFFSGAIMVAKSIL